jgi:hypothetical protein
MKKEYQRSVEDEDGEFEREIAKLLSDEPSRSGDVGIFSPFGRLGPVIPVADHAESPPTAGSPRPITHAATAIEPGSYDVDRTATLAGESVTPNEVGNSAAAGGTLQLPGSTAAPNPLAGGGLVAVTSWVDQMNEDNAWIVKEGAIYRTRYGDFIQPEKFRTQHNNRKVLTPSGKLVGAALLGLIIQTAGSTNVLC